MEDIDLALRQSAVTTKWNVEAVTAVLGQAAAINLYDGFEFAIGDPTLDLNAAPYGGVPFSSGRANVTFLALTCFFQALTRQAARCPN